MWKPAFMCITVKCIDSFVGRGKLTSRMNRITLFPSAVGRGGKFLGKVLK